MPYQNIQYFQLIARKFAALNYDSPRNLLRKNVTYSTSLYKYIVSLHVPNNPTFSTLCPSDLQISHFHS